MTTPLAFLVSDTLGRTWTVTFAAEQDGDCDDYGRPVACPLMLDYRAATCAATGEVVTFDDGTDEALCSFGVVCGFDAESALDELSDTFRPLAEAVYVEALNDRYGDFEASYCATGPAYEAPPEDM